MKEVIVFGGSFNPPGQHHVLVVQGIFEQFECDEVIIVPCGMRPDKEDTNHTSPLHRIAMAEMTFGDMEGVRLELFDLEGDGETFTRAWELEERFSSEGRVWHVVGTDLITGGGCGQSEIQRIWAKGKEIWQELNFLVIKRPGYEVDQADLPPHCQVIELDIPGSSSEIRTRVGRGESIDDLVTPRVAQYVERHRLYRK